MVVSTSITDFRNNLFEWVDLVVNQGYELEVEKNGENSIKVIKADDWSVRVNKLKQVAGKLAGTWKGERLDKNFFRGEKEIEYMNNLGK